MLARLNIFEKIPLGIVPYVGDFLAVFGPKKRCLMDLQQPDQLICLKAPPNHLICLKMQHNHLMCRKKVTGNDKIAIQCPLVYKEVFVIIKNHIILQKSSCFSYISPCYL